MNMLNFKKNKNWRITKTSENERKQKKLGENQRKQIYNMNYNPGEIELINYDKTKPLIAIHVPKSGGTSFREALKKWYGSKLYLHYYNEARGKLPKKKRLTQWFSDQYREGICIYGHFNKNREFGIESYYPEVTQFITILRDPFELAVSEYFYLKKVSKKWKDQSRVSADDLENYLMNMTPNMLNHFPTSVTLDNYKDLLLENFIYIGITEDMETSVKMIAKKLSFTSPSNLETLNKTVRTQRVPVELKNAFIEKNPIEYSVYEFAKAHYDK
jgi:hypothetical protein